MKDDLVDDYEKVVDFVRNHIVGERFKCKLVRRHSHGAMVELERGLYGQLEIIEFRDEDFARGRLEGATKRDIPTEGTELDVYYLTSKNCAYPSFTRYDYDWFYEDQRDEYRFRERFENVRHWVRRLPSDEDPEALVHFLRLSSPGDEYSVQVVDLYEDGAVVTVRAGVFGILEVEDGPTKSSVLDELRESMGTANAAEPVAVRVKYVHSKDSGVACFERA